MQTKVNENSFEGQSFYIGIDSHKKSWSVTILGETYEHKTMSQNPNPEILSGYMHRNYPGGYGVISYATDHRLPLTTYHLPLTDYRILNTDYPMYLRARVFPRGKVPLLCTGRSASLSDKYPSL